MVQVSVVGTAVTVTDRPGTLAVAVRRSQLVRAAHSQVARLTTWSWSGVGLVRMTGAGSGRNRAAWLASMPGATVGWPPGGAGWAGCPAPAGWGSTKRALPNGSNGTLVAAGSEHVAAKVRPPERLVAGTYRHETFRASPPGPVGAGSVAALPGAPGVRAPRSTPVGRSWTRTLGENPAYAGVASVTRSSRETSGATLRIGLSLRCC